MRISSLEEFCFYLGTSGKYFEVFATNDGICVNGVLDCVYGDKDIFNASDLMDAILNAFKQSKYSSSDEPIDIYGNGVENQINEWWEENYGLAALSKKTASFTADVIEECNSKGIDKPSAEEISEYITEKGFSVERFMKRHTLKVPFEKFKESLSTVTFKVTPTEKEMQSFFDNYGNDVDLFCRLHTIAKMKPIVRNTCQRTAFKLSTANLIKLWNTFIKESGLYGSDNHIYDLRNEEEGNYIQKNMDCDKLERIYKLIAKSDTHFVQVFDDNKILAKSNDDVLNLIVEHWEEIFENIMTCPFAYNFNIELFYKGDKSKYFDNIFFPVITKEVGYVVDTYNGTIEEINN